MRAEWTVGPVASDQEMAMAMALRRRVFVEEQRVPAELEYDEFDARATHVVALKGQEVGATGRLVPLEAGSARVGRMAVAPQLRRQGLGARVLACLEEEARRMDLSQMLLHAQVPVAGFYARQGYVAQGKPFLEAGIRHVTMTKRL